MRGSRSFVRAVAFASLIAAPAATASPVVYPAKGQSPEQQNKDQAECYNWAVGQTGFNPANSSGQTASSGGAVRGGARGAALGAVGGAIGGDAGKGAAIGAATGALIGGMRRRDQQRQQQAAANQASSNFDRAYGACLSGRGYTVR